MQRAADKFERRDPFPHVPFDMEEFDSMPSAAELIGWIGMFALLVFICFMFLGLV